MLFSLICCLSFVVFFIFICWCRFFKLDVAQAFLLVPAIGRQVISGCRLVELLELRDKIAEVLPALEMYSVIDGDLFNERVFDRHK